MAEQQGMPREVIMVTQLAMAVFAGCIYVALPGLFLGLLHRESVRATCLRRDPTVTWTDRCPMPVLAMSIVLWLWALLLPFERRSTGGLPRSSGVSSPGPLAQ